MVQRQMQRVSEIRRRTRPTAVLSTLAGTSLAAALFGLVDTTSSSSWHHDCAGTGLTRSESLAEWMLVAAIATLVVAVCIAAWTRFHVIELRLVSLAVGALVAVIALTISYDHHPVLHVITPSSVRYCGPNG